MKAYVFVSKHKHKRALHDPETHRRLNLPHPPCPDLSPLPHRRTFGIAIADSLGVRDDKKKNIYIYIYIYNWTTFGLGCKFYIAFPDKEAFFLIAVVNQKLLLGSKLEFKPIYLFLANIWTQSLLANSLSAVVLPPSPIVNIDIAIIWDVRGDTLRDTQIDLRSI